MEGGTGPGPAADHGGVTATILRRLENVNGRGRVRVAPSAPARYRTGRMKVVVSGIGIAGPALAFWLERAGHQVLLVEEAPRLRSGGYVVDVWGVGYDLLERMGLIRDVLSAGYRIGEVRSGPVADWFVGRDLRDDIEVPEYGSGRRGA